MAEITIAGRSISENSNVFVIAELSANHNHNFDLAVKSIQEAKKSGADAIKIQTYTADTITIDSEKECFKISQGTIWDGTTLYKLYQKAYTPWDWQPKLKKVADDLGIILFSSPFDNSSVDFLENMSVPAYKIASFEITDIPLIEYVASKGKPVILSTGIAEMPDIEEAVAACKRMGNDQIALLKCTSAYPTPPEEMNLRTIPDMRDRFGVVIGLSDHTLGSSASVAACALGAQIIEKHFILDRGIGGPDASFSMEPLELKTMIEQIRFTEKALGRINYSLTPMAARSREHSRSIFIGEDIRAGEEFTEKNLRIVRPGYGLHPRLYASVLGRRASRAIEKGTPLELAMVQ